MIYAPISSGYNPKAWFWIVAGDESRAWSSAAGEYVTDFPADRVTRIASEADLNDVLRPYGLALPAPTIDDYKTAIQAHIDAVARAKDYENGFALAGYATDPYAAHADAAQAFINWRSAVWVFTFQTLAVVQSGELSQPTIPDLLAMLPAPPWTLDNGEQA